MVVYFHVAPRTARDSIRAHGLDHTRGESAYRAHIEYPAGTYLFLREGDAYAYQAIRQRQELDEYGPEAVAYDVWAVTCPLVVFPDPFRDDESGLGEYSVFTTEHVAPCHVRLV